MTAPLRIVSIGGGTGLSALLSGLKKYTQPSGSPAIDVTAIVTVSDDGGSSGRLRREFEVLPPGDIRNCMVALSEDEALLSQMFQYRFSAGAGLDGHSFGNLFLTVLTALTQDFAEAVKLSSAMLATRGRILPATNRVVELGAELADGTFVVGETSIATSSAPIRRAFLIPENVTALPETLDAIAEADLITVGPGSLYTSLIPNLLVKGIPEAIAASKAVKVCVCNLMTQPNESLGLTAAGHIKAIYEHVGGPLFDCVLINRSPFPPELLAKYAGTLAAPVECNAEELTELGVRLVEGDYVADGEVDVARHNTDAVARDLLAIAAEHLGAEAAASASAIL